MTSKLAAPSAVEAMSARRAGSPRYLANAAEYLALPCVAACGCRWLADGSLVRAGDYDEIERRARAMRELAEVQ